VDVIERRYVACSISVYKNEDTYSLLFPHHNLADVALSQIEIYLPICMKRPVLRRSRSEFVETISARRMQVSDDKSVSWQWASER
jgi:hypothetical protein